MQQFDYKINKISKTVGGRIQLKVEKKAQTTAPPLVAKKVHLFLYDPSDDSKPSDSEEEDEEMNTISNDKKKYKFGDGIRKV